MLWIFLSCTNLEQARAQKEIERAEKEEVRAQQNAVRVEEERITNCHRYGGSPQSPNCWDLFPCADATYVLTEVSSAQCRPDQETVVRWEPPLTGERNDNEARPGGVVTCRCLRASVPEPSDGN